MRVRYLRDRLSNMQARAARMVGVIPYVEHLAHVSEQERRIEAGLYEAYINYRPVPLGVDVLFLTADTPPEWPTVTFDDPLMGWGNLLRGRISQCAIPGAHLSIFAPQNLPVLATRMRNGLERAERANHQPWMNAV
jgi:thioesterase domain-containing protein